MRLLPLMALALTMHAGAIADATSTASILLHPADSLEFQVMSWNFGFNATRFGFNPYPTDVSFTFVTASTDADASVSAWLESPDTLYTAAFAGPLDFTPGLFSSSQYRGTVSTLRSYLHLSPELSAEIFAGGSALLVLRNDGPDVLLGLPPNTLRQDLSVSLTGGPLSVGGLSGGVSFQSAPEPATVLVGLFAPIVMGLARRHKESTVCKHPIYSDTI